MLRRAAGTASLFSTRRLLHLRLDIRGHRGAFSEHAAAAFTALVHNIELAAATGAITAPEPRAAAQQIWSAVHGAVTLELKRLVQVPDPEAAFRALIATLLRGMAQIRTG